MSLILREVGVVFSNAEPKGLIRGLLRRASGDIAIASVLFATLGALYHQSPVRYPSDSLYTVLLSEQLLLNQSFDLSVYFTPWADSSHYPKASRDTGLPRHVRRHRGALHHIYPSGSSVLSVPLLAGLRGLGFSTLTADGRYSAKGELKIQAALASLITAATATVLYLMARQLLPTSWSLVITLAAALGSQLWSIASRVLWSHTWGLLLLSSALWLLLRSESLKMNKPLHPVWLASLLSWSFFVRPTAIAAIVPITVWMLWRYRRHALVFLATGGAWFAGFLIHSQTVFGRWLPAYYQRGERLGLDTLDLGLAANLASPGRGLLVYSPWLLFTLYLVIRHGRRLPHRGLAFTAAAAISCHILIVSSNSNWWAGTTYGPRFTTETIPFWVLLTVLGWRAALDHVSATRWHHRLAWAAALALLIPSWTFHGAGAWSKSWVPWNSLPTQIAWQPKRVFDWQEAQFLWALDPGRVKRHRHDLKSQ